MSRKDKQQKQKKPQTLNDKYSSSYTSVNRHMMEMEHVPFDFDQHLLNYNNRRGREGSERIRQMNHSIAMDEAYQSSKIEATGKPAPKTNPSVVDELSESVMRSFDKTVNKFSTVAGTYLGGKFAKWSYGKIVAASAATGAVLTVGLYSG
ncbi:hypothetical protein SAMN05660964_03824, partial [Thiothrix caldifontis]